ncbi:dephospho-CoA kinase [Synechococcus elongatus IITB4]|uniref:dephospho-CoA kinase n=1 Tax=Synechococcus elongatus TaxID=32046 RepID=UPI0030D38D1A
MGAPNHLNPAQRRIGLTGGIATGKSTVADYLRDRYQLPILDADRYAREVVAVGSPVLQSIRDRYGASILLADGQLDRQKLGAIIFADPTERQWLEQQTHPAIRACFERDLAQLPAEATVVLVIPLLFEAGLQSWVQEIWVVACPPEQQCDRLIHRDRLPVTEAEQRLAAQWPLTQKCEQADIVIDNSRDRAFTFQQVDQALERSFSQI